MKWYSRHRKLQLSSAIQASGRDVSHGSPFLGRAAGRGAVSLSRTAVVVLVVVVVVDRPLPRKPVPTWMAAWLKC